ARTLGLEVEREFFAVRCDDQCFHVQATLDGVGIGALQPHIAERYEHIERVLPEFRLPALPVWVVAHHDVKRSPRIRVVFDALGAGLAKFYSSTEPPAA
ncbi:MAG: LysR substrate-binding domain-containing protein, partial [Myxococcota bacterium]